MSEAITVAGGTPTLTLNDDGTATYTGESAANALAFSYTVMTGQNTPDLTVSGLHLNGATITDAAGNNANFTTLPTPIGTLQIDTTPPAPPVISTDTLNRHKSVTLTGTAEANDTITVYDTQGALGQTHANTSGAWSFSTAPLKKGIYIFTATATDAAGNVSVLSNSIDPPVGVTGTDLPPALGPGSKISLGNGNNTVSPGDNSTVTLGNGNNTVFGSANDTIAVGNGQNQLVAAPGDVWTVGNGHDVFGFNAGFGDNTITDFNTSRDVLQFNHALFANYAAAMADTKQLGANTVITYDANDAVTLNGVMASHLTASNFKFT